MSATPHVEIAVIGAGIAGVATTYYLCRKYRKRSVALIDYRPPMSFTSAQSGDNYRNWWPDPVMAEFTNKSIELLEDIARESDNDIAMTHGGYVLATRSNDVDSVIAELLQGYGETATHDIRVHWGNKDYRPAGSSEWPDAVTGVDVLSGRALIARHFPCFSQDIRTVVHIRRGGDFDSHRLGQYMIDHIGAVGGTRVRAKVTAVQHGSAFELTLAGNDGVKTLQAENVILAPGPFAAEVAGWFGIEIDLDNFYQQKIAFGDRLGAVPRAQPFSIDLDEQTLAWTDDEREQLAEDENLAWLLRPISGGVHCRPDGGLRSDRVKLGWAINRHASELRNDLNDSRLGLDFFPEIVLRAASTLQPALRDYVERPPTHLHLYGGYYTMTPENWPLIGPTTVPGLYLVTALSGFGSMSACAAGAICADWVAGFKPPEFAARLTPARHADAELMAELRSRTNKGVL